MEAKPLERRRPYTVSLQQIERVSLPKRVINGASELHQGRRYMYVRKELHLDLLFQNDVKAQLQYTYGGSISP